MGRNVEEFIGIVKDTLNDSMNLTKADISSKLIDLQINSFEYASLIVSLEEYYNLEFEYDFMIMGSFETLSDVYQYIVTKKQRT